MKYISGLAAQEPLVAQSTNWALKDLVKKISI